MSATTFGVLIVSECEDDSALADLVLRQAYPEAVVLVVTDALEFADRLAAGAFSVAIVDETLSWADGVAVFQAIERRYPTCAGLLLTSRFDGTEPPEPIDVVVPKSSRGFVRLPSALERARRFRRARSYQDVHAGAYWGVFSLN